MCLQWSKTLVIIIASCVALSCQNSKKIIQSTNHIPGEYQSIYDDVQKKTFQYFWDGAEPNSGMARERFNVNDVYPDNDKNIITTGGSGFGVMAILVGIDRGFITK